MRLDVSGSTGGRRSRDASPERPGTANSAAPTAASDHPSPRTVYSDVSHLKADNVGYAIGMRDKRGSPGLEEAFLPRLEEEDGSRDGTDPFDNRSFTSLESMAGEYDGCPTDHPTCLEREERWIRLEELLEQRAEDLKEVEDCVNEASKEVEGMRNETNFLIKQYGKKEEQWVEKSEANSVQRKELDQLEQHATETVAAIEKAKAEIISFNLQLKDQEAAIARKMADGAASTECDVVFGPGPLPWMLSEDDHRLNRAVRKLPEPYPANAEKPILRRPSLDRKPSRRASSRGSAMGTPNSPVR